MLPIKRETKEGYSSAREAEAAAMELGKLDDQNCDHCGERMYDVLATSEFRRSEDGHNPRPFFGVKTRRPHGVLDCIQALRWRCDALQREIDDINGVSR